MKKINLILGALVCLFAFSACNDEVGYTPASSESAEGVYYPSTLPSKIDLKSDANSFDVQICRSSKVGVQAVALNVQTTDTVGFFIFPDTVVFEDGDNTANITIGYQFDPENIPYGKYYDVEISVNENEASAYGSKTYVFQAGIPEPWVSLGKAKFTDAFFFVDTYEVEVQQHSFKPNQFRLVRPYHEAFEVDDNGYWGGPWEGTDEYLTFKILQPGESLGDAQITMSDLVYFAPFCTGWNNPSYNDIVNVYHPVTFTKYQDEKFFTYNKVVSYQENGLPAVVQLAPFYYMDNTGGWDQTQKDGYITIVFPGVVLTDYSVELEYLGRFTDANDNVFADLAVTMGEDVASVKVGVALSEDVQGVLTGVLDGSLNPVELTAAGTTRFALSKPGKYTAVAVSYDADGTPQEAYYTQFEYSAAGGPVWNDLGMAQYTEGIISSVFEVDAVTYQVPVQENAETPGLYRLVNPYGAAYPYNQEGDYDTSKDYYLEINAVDPQGVYIPTQQLGFDWGYGMFSAASMGAYYMENGNTFEDVKAAGFCGTLVDGVITFPVKGMVLTIPSEGLFYANSNGAFKVVLPSATKSSKSVKAVVNKREANKTNVNGVKLKKMEKQLPVKVQVKK